LLVEAGFAGGSLLLARDLDGLRIGRWTACRCWPCARPGTPVRCRLPGSGCWSSGVAGHSLLLASDLDELRVER
jgi:hypothetical protein